ncbi:MAG TPA: septum formation initiator family protein [bacterium]|nr:septum formation initiator family protein [bacterium]HQQ37991.1 septum formation initiator family protein [bacterium]
MTKQKMISNLKASRRRETNFLYRFLVNPRTFAIIALVFLLLIFLPLAKNYSRKRLVEQEIAGIQKEIDDFEAKNRDLKEMIDYLQSDQSLEEQARLNMGLKRPGEIVAVIQEDTAVDAISSPVLVDDSPNWQKWWRYFAN